MNNKSTEYLRRYLESENIQLVALGVSGNTAVVNVVGMSGMEEREIDIDWREVLVWKMANVDAPLVNAETDRMLVEAVVGSV